MQVESYYGHTIARTHLDQVDYYANNELKKSYKRVFDLPEIKDRYRGAEWDSHDGDGESSEDLLLLGPYNLHGADNLNNWIKSQVLIALNTVYNKPCQDVECIRSWMNRMNRGSRGKCHMHKGNETFGAFQTPDLVTIFYVTNDNSGSKLCIIKDGVHGKLPEYFEEKVELTTMPGDLIMHDENVWHAITLHDSDEPRICFVYHWLVKD